METALIAVAAFLGLLVFAHVLGRRRSNPVRPETHKYEEILKGFPEEERDFMATMLRNQAAWHEKNNA